MSDNLTRFYWAKYDNALKNFHAGNLDATQEACSGLIFEFMCPRFCQIQAYQLQSLCTEDWWSARRSLEGAISIIEGLDDDGEVMVEMYREHTNKMLEEVQEKLEERYHSRGLEVPDDEPEEELFDDDDASELPKGEEDDDSHALKRITEAAEFEAFREMEKLTLKDTAGLSRESLIQRLGGFVPASEFQPTLPIGQLPPEDQRALAEWAAEQTEQQLEEMELVLNLAREEERRERARKAFAAGLSSSSLSMDMDEQEQSQLTVVPEVQTPPLTPRAASPPSPRSEGDGDRMEE